VAGSGSDPTGRVAYVKTIQPGLRHVTDDVTSSQQQVVVSADVNTGATVSNSIELKLTIETIVRTNDTGRVLLSPRKETEKLSVVEKEKGRVFVVCCCYVYIACLLFIFTRDDWLTDTVSTAAEELSV